MPDRRVVFAHHFHRAQYLYAGRIHGNKDLRLLLAGGGVGARLHHHDHDLAARVAGAGNVEFLAIDHPLVAIEHSRRADILGVRRGDARLCHGIGRADLAGEQRLQPLFLLRGRAHALQHFHVAGVGRVAVHGFRAIGMLAQLGGDIGIV